MASSSGARTSSRESSSGARTSSRESSLPVTVVNGFVFPSWCTEARIEDCTKFVARDDDIVICSYPFSTSSWILYCLWKLINLSYDIPNYNTLLDSLMPHLEASGTARLPEAEGPRIIRTNLPYQLINMNPRAKYIYVTRHPKDVVTSYFIYAKYRIGEELTLDNFFKDFDDGLLPYGDYFKHVRDWFDNRKNNVHFLNFEYMHIDPIISISDTAQFLGRRHFEACDNKVIDRILQFSKLDYKTFTYVKYESASAVGTLIVKQLALATSINKSRREPTLKCINRVGISSLHLTTKETQVIDLNIELVFGEGAYSIFGVTNVLEMLYF